MVKAGPALAAGAYDLLQAQVDGLRGDAYLVDDDASFELLYGSAEAALETVSPITASYPAPLVAITS
jgi:hypothetical protein